MNLTLVALLAVIYSAGFYLLLHRSLMRVVLGIVLLGHGANLFLLAAGGPAAAPPLGEGGTTEHAADPLPQAMALTAIVITFAVTTFLLALVYRSFAQRGSDEVQDDVEDARIRRASEAEDEPESVIGRGWDEP